MTEDIRHTRLREVFDRTMDAAPHERPEVLARECAGDEDMLRRIESMLIAAEGRDPFVRASAEENAAADREIADEVLTADRSTQTRRWLGEAPGTKIDAYKLLQLIGEGGFGSVYLAEQEKPVRRRVALKILKLGMDTRQIMARFEAERQALALMEHPNIAKVFDAGATASGRPYFVMELVRGDPITQYCDTNNLNTAGRLGLFVDACLAVHHAHQKGVIHRDIKSSNVLVSVADGKAIPKVIDFGIAKATSAQLTENTLVTEHRQMVGTPEYMSPEQAEMTGVDIDTRSDVYSLGVLLYVLLTGTTPFGSRQLREAAVGEMQRIIREADPPRPSTRVSSMVEDLAVLAAHRQVEPDKLARLIRGDLDWIVMKCLEKDRTRRYDSAAALADDVQRHLAGEAVLAAPASTAYRVRKFVRRNRAGVLAGSLLAAALVLGVIGTSIGMAWALREEGRSTKAMIAAQQSAEQESQAKREAQGERTRAVNEASRAEFEAGRAREAQREAQSRASELAQVVEFQSSMLNDIDVGLMGERLRADVLAEADAQFALQRLDAGEIAAQRATLERAIADLNFTNPAIASLDRNVLQRALDAIDKTFADQPLVQARLLHTIADTRHSLGRLDEARPPLEHALEIRRRLLGDTHLDTLDSISNLATLIHDLGDADSAEPLYREALEGYRAARGDNDPQTLTALSNMGYLLESQGKIADAERIYREVLDTRRRVLGNDHEHTLLSAANLGVLLRAQDKLDEAEPLYREALDGYRRTLGDEHPWTLGAINNMAFLLADSGAIDEAIALHREALQTRRRVHGDAHRDTRNSIYSLARLLRKQGRLAEAEPLYRETLHATRAALGEDHPEALLDAHNLATLLHKIGRFDEAAQLLRETVDRSALALGDAHADTQASRLSLCGLLIERGETLIHEEGDASEQAKAADELLTEAWMLSKRVAPESAVRILPRLGKSIEALIALDERSGRNERAANWRARLAELDAPTATPETTPATTSQPQPATA